MKTIYIILLVSAFMVGGCGGGKGSMHENNGTSTDIPDPEAQQATWRKLRDILSGRSNESISSEELNSLEGVSGAETGRDYTEALELAQYATPGNPTAAEIQAVIDTVNASHPPHISGTPAEAVQAEHAYTFTPRASDTDGDTLVFSIKNKPTWASFNTATGTLSGTPDNADAKTYNNIILSVTDGTDTVSLPPFSITVVHVNHPPSISGTPAEAVQAEHVYTFTPSASDTDGDTLAFSTANNRPDWLSISSTTGTLQGTPPISEIGKRITIVLQVSDGKEVASLPPFTLTIKKDNTTPSISGTPNKTIQAEQTYTFTPSASDTDGDTLAFSIKNKPTWASFNTATGTLSGTPNNADAKTYNNIILSVTDGTDTVALPPFKITVVPINHPPTISGTSLTVLDVNKPYSFVPEVNDLDGDHLSFSIENAPDWLELNTSNGSLRGTPQSTGIATDINLSVADDEYTRSLSFSLTVKIPIGSCGDSNTTHIPPGAHIHQLESDTHIRLWHFPDGNRTACIVDGDAGIITD